MNRRILVVGTALVLMLLTVRILDPLPMQQARLALFDTMQRVAPRAYLDLPVRVVDIDEASLAEIGQFPWPRSTMAALTDRLAELGAAAIAFDILFPEQDRLSPRALLKSGALDGLLADDIPEERLDASDTDARFATAIGRAPVVLGTARIDQEDGVAPGPPKGGTVMIGNRPDAALPILPAVTPLLPELAERASGVGVISMDPRAESTRVRTVPLLWNSGAGIVPTLSVEALRVAMGESGVTLWGLGDLEAAIEGVSVGDVFVPTNSNGRLWLRARRDHPDLYVSARTLLGPPERAEAVADRIAGNIVLIGTSAAGLLDLRVTPLGQTVPGVSIHAQALEQMLTGDVLVRDDFVQGAEMLALIVVSFVVVVVMSARGPLVSLFAGAVTAFAIAGAAWWGFIEHGLLLDAGFPLVGGFVAYSLLTGFQVFVIDKEKRLIRRSFSHYVAADVLTQIEDSGHNLALGGEMRELSVMFSDIRGFTPLSETLEATDLVALLNRLFDGLGERIMAERGTIDKFIGDAIMAFWNAPLETPDHQLHAGRAALGMRAALARMIGEGDVSSLRICIGIASGTACVGNIGSRDRYNYSVIGEVVNQAARIETACRHVDYDILLSAEAADPRLATLDAGALSLKGVTSRVPVAILVGDEALARTPEFAELSRRHRNLLEALARGGADVTEAMERALELAVTIEPGLAGFYNRLASRSDDIAGARMAAV